MDAESRHLLDNLYRHVFVTFQAVTRLQTPDRRIRDAMLTRIDVIHDALAELVRHELPHEPHLASRLRDLHARLDVVNDDLDDLRNRSRRALAVAR